MIVHYTRNTMYTLFGKWRTVHNCVIIKAGYNIELGETEREIGKFVERLDESWTEIDYVSLIDFSNRTLWTLCVVLRKKEKKKANFNDPFNNVRYKRYKRAFCGYFWWVSNSIGPRLNMTASRQENIAREDNTATTSK